MKSSGNQASKGVWATKRGRLSSERPWDIGSEKNLSGQSQFLPQFLPQGGGLNNRPEQNNREEILALLRQVSESVVTGKPVSVSDLVRQLAASFELSEPFVEWIELAVATDPALKDDLSQVLGMIHAEAGLKE